MNFYWALHGNDQWQMGAITGGGLTPMLGYLGIPDAEAMAECKRLSFLKHVSGFKRNQNNKSTCFHHTLSKQNNSYMTHENILLFTI